MYAIYVGHMMLFGGATFPARAVVLVRLTWMHLLHYSILVIVPLVKSIIQPMCLNVMDQAHPCEERKKKKKQEPSAK